MKTMDDANTHIPLYKTQLCAIFMINAIQGITQGFVGPSLKDLQCTYNVDKQQISLFFPIHTACVCIGCLLYLLHNGSRREYLELAVSSLGIGVTFAVLGISRMFWGSIITIAGAGFLSGLMGAVMIVKTGQLGKVNVLPYHIGPFGFTAGNVIGPLVMYPFLGSKTENTSANESILNATIDSNFCAGSNIENGLFTLTALFIVVACGFFLLHWCLTCRSIQREAKTECVKTENPASNCKKGWATFLFVTISLITGFFAGTANVVYSNLLSTFGIHSEIQEDASTMALMTSSFSAVTLIGRFSSMFLSYILSQRCLFLTSLLGVLGSAVLLLCVGEISTVSLWVGSSLLALFYAPVYGSLLGWSENTVPLTSTFMILMTGCDNAGLSVLSLIIGQLMAIFTVNMLNVSFAVVGIIQLVNFGCMFSLSKYIPPAAKGYICLDETNNN